jgi:hypothetical protein
MGAIALVAASGRRAFLRRWCEAPVKADLIFALGGDNGGRAAVLEHPRACTDSHVGRGRRAFQDLVAYPSWRARYLIDGDS